MPEIGQRSDYRNRDLGWFGMQVSQQGRDSWFATSLDELVYGKNSIGGGRLEFSTSLTNPLVPIL